MPKPYVPKTFGSLPETMAERFPDREALVFGDQRLTFSQVNDEIDRVARGFIAVGIKPGDKVALWLMNQPEWIFIMFALAKVGAIQVPVNTRFRTHDLSYLLKQSDCAFVITHDTSGPVDFLGMVREVLRVPDSGHWIEDPGFPKMRGVIVLSDQAQPGTIGWADVLAQSAAVPQRELRSHTDHPDPQDTAFIMYTSGTTGMPKGVMHSHNLLRLIEFRAAHMDMSENDIILNYLPLFHLFGYSEGALLSMLTGAKQILMATFDPDEAMRLVEAEKVTMMHGFETHLKDLVEAQARQQCDTSSLTKGIFAAGMQSATPIFKKAFATFPTLRPITGFGMSEVGVGVTLGALDDNLSQRAESSGGTMDDHEVRIVDPESGDDQPVGVPGELLVKGYSVMRGYYNKPEETAKCFDADGWFHTGDTACWRDDGYIRFLGRYKDMLKVGGENVDPMEVEGLLLEHSDVHQIAVVALPDARLGEVPVAFIQRVSRSDATETAIIDYCRGKVASFKIPRHVMFVDEFPMTSSGKIRKVELREIAAKEFAG